MIRRQMMKQKRTFGRWMAGAWAGGMLLAVFAGQPAGAQQPEPIDMDLPMAMFVGTPQDFAVPNLEPPLGEPRPEFLAPAGTENVALDKWVEGSAYEPESGDFSQIVDDEKEAYDGSIVVLPAGPQYVTIDLEELYTIYAVAIWHYHMQARVYKDVVVQASTDPDFILDVTTLFNNDHDNSLGLGVGDDLHYVETHEGKLIDARGIEGQYVRLYSNGNTYDDLNHYIEVCVYGKPAP